MLRGALLHSFRRKLLSWFCKYQRDLPWRRTKDPYRIWLSEIMLQQTRVATVIPYYERFLERFPDIQALAAAPQEEVLRLWSGLGYYSRARNLQRAAQQIAAKHSGVFPQAYNDALALSGVGDYTAAAILSIAFGAKAAVLDGNVARVLARILALRGNLREARRWKLLQQAANELLDTKSPGDWNQAIMELGAVVCTPRSPQCLVCPVSQFCKARKLGIADVLPARQKKPETVDVTLAAAVFIDPQGRTIVLGPHRVAARKAAHDDIATMVSGMWHFPTVAVKRDAAAELATLVKKLSQRNSLRARALGLEPLAKVRHTVTYRRITVLPFRIRVARPPDIADSSLVSLHELISPGGLAVSNLTRKVARAALVHNSTAVRSRNEMPAEPALFPSPETTTTTV